MGIHDRNRCWGLIAPVLAFAMSVIATGCGSDSKPPSTPGTVSVMGLVSVLPDGKTQTIVVVSDRDGLVLDATVTANGVPVPREEDIARYWTEHLAVSPGDRVTLQVVSPHGNLTQETTVPAVLRISTPSNGAAFADDEEIPVAWNNVPNTSIVRLNYYDDDVRPFCFAELPAGSVSFVIPACKTVVGTNTIAVAAMRGTGAACPLNSGSWRGQTGLWVSSTEEIDVTVHTSIPQPGRCCALDGTCTVTLPAACTGAWTAAGACAPNPCIEATGACCALDGTCAVTTQVACTGTWIPARVCAPNPCPLPPLPTGMVWIPAGNVRLGQACIAEPVHDVYLDGFYSDRYEVSNVRYKTFIDAGGYTTAAHWNPVGWSWRVANSITLPEFWNDNGYHGGGIAGNEQFPVIGVSWWEADAYCRWAGGRLPTEAEWEKAAKGGCETHGEPGQCEAADTPTYPWGEGLDWTGAQANWWLSGDPYDGRGVYGGYTTPVGYYDGSNHDGYQTIDSPSPYGLYDVAGNVWEWCSTKYGDYPYNPNDGRENPPVSYAECCRVLRGGSWSINDGGYAGFLRCAYRFSLAPHYRFNSVGFRCARTD